MPLASSQPQANHILAALPTEEFERLLPALEHADLPLGRVLFESGGEQEYVYFPTTGIVSLLHIMEDGFTSEMAVVGFDGVVGMSLFMGGASTPSRAVVQSGGDGYRVRAKILKAEFDRAGPLHFLLLRAIQALFVQVAQTGACNRHHSIDQQLCRWLLLSLDLLPSNDLQMTHELIGNMLGVRREGVTAAAGLLQRAGLIRYSRGKITLLDRKGLETRACECYAVVKRETDRLIATFPYPQGVGLRHGVQN